MTTEELNRAIEILAAGGVIAAATDTLVGLLALAESEEATSRVLAIKGVDRRSPLPVLIADERMAQALAVEFSTEAQKLSQEGWPGPLTLVVPVREGVLAPAVLAGGSTVGLRVPGPSPALDIVRKIARPLTGTSANLTGAPPVTATTDLDPRVIEAVDLTIDGGNPTGTASRVIDVTGNVPRVLRGSGSGVK